MLRILEEEINKEINNVLHEQFKGFIEPFTDVIKTARHGLSNVSATAWTKVGSLAKQAAALAIPFINISSIEDEANQKLEQKLSQIDSQFGDIIKKNIDTLNDSDFWGLAFAFAPHQFFTSKVAKQVPEVTLGVLDSVTGGKFPVVKKMEDRLKSLHMNMFHASDGGATGGTGFGGAMDYGSDIGYDFGESVIREQQKQPTKSQVNAAVGEKVMQIISNPQVQQAIENSPKTKAMQKAAFDSVIETLEDYLSFETPEEMKKIFGSKFDSFKRELEKTLPEGATEEQQQELWNQMVPQIKNNIKTMYIKQLQNVANQVPAAKANISKLVAKIHNL